MKSVIFFAALAAAAPLNKRGVVYSTTTQEVVETLWTTTTDFVDPTATGGAGFFENHSRPAPSASAPSAQVPAPVSSAPTQAPSSPSVPSVQAPSTPPTSSSQAPAPTVQPPSSSQAPALTVQPPSTTQAPVVSSPTSTAAPQAATAIASSSSGGSLQYTGGDGTFYDVAAGTGSCGTTGSPSEHLVAIAAGVMGNGANSNANPKCGKTINIQYGGKSTTAKVFDTCPTCDGNSLDMSNSLFQFFADETVGRIHGVSWGFA